ncbi:6-phosphogluconate dehydrogenase [Flavobacterium sp.]|uniref:6-phosphogluconate dehydrogenase n=1 Tax=Flavobacterium sp. TaxID=239 RepID=UPI003D6B2FDE
MLRKFIFIVITTLVLGITGYFTVLYYATYSEGDRTGELIKFSSKGYVFKTFEGEISQGISGAQIFRFSVLDSDTQVITDLKKYQGQYVKITYIERYRTFPWWGDTRYFVTHVQQEKSPHFAR